MTSPASTYLRVRICGTLTCESDLHVGSGSVLPWEERTDLPAGRERPDIATKPEYHAVCWSDACYRPYLPASTLRGSLRAMLLPEAADELFGFVKPPEEGGGRGGKVRLFDAYFESPSTWGECGPPAYWSALRKTGARHGIALNPLTGTVKNGRLFSHELVPAGSAFRVEMELDRVDEKTVATLCALLRRWDGSLSSSLGGKRGKGWGRVRWSCEHVRVLTSVKLAEWLAADGAADLNAYFEDIDPPAAEADVATSAPTIKYALIIDGPILVNEPGYCQAKTNDNLHPPSQEFSRRPNGAAILPGKSLVGVIRSRARRIAATIAHQHGGAEPAVAVKVAEELVSRLFGNETRRGALWLSDAEVGEGVVQHHQFFNAIDRFTGGVKDQALYHAKAQAGGQWKGTMRFEAMRLATSEPRDWWKGLLLFVARDALEGELAVGWGKAKGYGAFCAQLTLPDGTTIEDWAGLLAQARSWGEPQAWINYLHAFIEERIPVVRERLTRETARPALQTETATEARP